MNDQPRSMERGFLFVQKPYQAFKHIRRYFQLLMLCLIYKMVGTVKRVLTVSFFINKKRRREIA